MHTVFNLSARYPCNLLCFRNAERELTLLSNVLFLYLYETNQQQYEREVAWICNRHCAFRLAGRDGFRRRTAILGANGKKVGVLVAVRRRRRARVESPHLTRVVPRQEMFQGVPASAYSDHHVSPLQKPDEDISPSDMIPSFANLSHLQFGTSLGGALAKSLHGLCSSSHLKTGEHMPYHDVKVGHWNRGDIFFFTFYDRRRVIVRHREINQLDVSMQRLLSEHPLRCM